MRSIGITLSRFNLVIGYISNNIDFALKLKKEGIEAIEDLEAESQINSSLFLTSSLDTLYIGYPGYYKDLNYESLGKIILGSNLQLYKYAYKKLQMDRLDNLFYAIDLSIFKFIYDHNMRYDDFVRIKKYLLERRYNLYYDSEELFRYIYENFDPIVMMLL
jgi:hypothetical protein